MRAEGIDFWLLARQCLSLATRKAGDRWSFYVAAAIRQALQHPDDLQAELLRLPVKALMRLTRTLSLYGETLEQATATLRCWAQERWLKRESDAADQAAYRQESMTALLIAAWHTLPAPPRSASRSATGSSRAT